jgi:hypothetical protein
MGGKNLNNQFRLYNLAMDTWKVLHDADDL